MSRLLGSFAVIAVALAAAGCGGSGGGTSGTPNRGYLGPLTTSGSRPCGHVTAGRPWNVKASPSVACGSARRLVSTFYAHNCPVGSASHPNTSCTLAGYTCLEAPPAFKGGFIWCTDGKRSVVAS